MPTTNPPTLERISIRATGKKPAAAIPCRYIGIVARIEDGLTKEKFSLEVYHDPVSGRYFAIDTRATLTHGPSFANFLSPADVRPLDLSHEPNSDLPTVVPCRFLQAPAK
jgi:hypothetical protein